MTSPSRFAVFALALSLSALSIRSAHAEVDAPPPPQGEHEHTRAGKPHYPMKAEEFKHLIEKKIASVKNLIDKKLERHGVSADRRAQIRHTVDVAAGDLRAALEKATADGVVTKEESVKVHAVADKLRGKVRKELRDEKNAEKKSAGANPPRDEKPAKKTPADDKPVVEKKNPDTVKKTAPDADG